MKKYKNLIELRFKIKIEYSGVRKVSTTPPPLHILNGKQIRKQFQIQKNKILKVYEKYEKFICIKLSQEVKLASICRETGN